MSETAIRSTQRGRTESEFAKPGIPALTAPEGILYDFNYGCRVQVPVDGWRVRMTDLDTFNVLFDETVEANAVVTSRRKYFVRFLLEEHADASSYRTYPFQDSLLTMAQDRGYREIVDLPFSIDLGQQEIRACSNYYSSQKREMTCFHSSDLGSDG